MNINKTLNLLKHGNQLKRTPRTGWFLRGVPNAEDVAAHSYGVVFTALILAQEIAVDFDMERLLIMATLHDLPEGLTTDIPTPAWKLMPKGIKTGVERDAMQAIFQDIPYAPDLMAVWEELHVGETAEAKLVHDADKIDMFPQAVVYEQQTSNRHLKEFWTEPFQFHFPEAQALYDLLREQRSKL